MKYKKHNLKPLILALAFLVVAGISFWIGRKTAPPETAYTEPLILTPKIPKPVTMKPVKKEIKKSTARIAIILDDWGQNSALVEKAIEINRPMTLAILPHLPKSREIAEKAQASGLGIMLHMPMQPKGKRQPTEPRMIRTNSSSAEIIEYLERALESVPYAQGVNNHQGSAATSDARVMKTVLGYLKKKGLFFIDSRVIASSVCGEVADEVGIRFQTRDVFIDNQATVDAVKAKLREAQRIALARGYVIAIGHDKKPTLEAIAQMVPEFEKNGVKLVLAKDLVE